MERINEYIRTKETYKIINYHVPIEPEIIIKYDNLLMESHCELLNLLKILFILLEYDDLTKLLDNRTTDIIRAFNNN